ncbi:MAG: hypothetical protein JW827_11025 [Spirochaetes bacterium]|nr:hypothetical protein [Spirochaetota bacterium]
MKKAIYIACSLLFMIVIVIFLTGQTSKAKGKYWYQVTVTPGDTKNYYDYYGSTSLSEEEFIKRLKGNDYIVLENLVYFDKEGEVHSWDEWNSVLENRIYINPKSIISVNPVKESEIKISE